MRILIVSAELAPLAEAGGVAQYAMGLARALSHAGHEVQVAIPGYRFLPDDDPPLLQGVTVHRLGDHAHFRGVADHRAIYHTDDFTPWIDFAKSTVAFLRKMDWTPDIVHCQDCHAALVPVLMAEERTREPNAFGNARTVLTIHNLLEQGKGPRSLYDGLGVTALGYDTYFEYYGDTNCYKAGLKLADRVATVSETYAREIVASDEFGFGLSGVLSNLPNKPTGIVNGIDGSIWSMPSLKYDGSDSVETLRAEKRAALSRVLPNWSATASEPVIAFKARWDRQKGIGLVSSCVESILEQARFIFDTWGEPRDVSAPYYETWQQLQAFSHKYPMRFAINVPGTTSPIESAALYTAADFLLMPSVYEPCGLAQMECQRYGCVPIVRSTGGLADTVIHLSNGVVFHTMTSTGLLRGIGDAVDAYADNQMMARLIGETLRQRNEWQHRVGQYVSLYQDVRNWAAS